MNINNYNKFMKTVSTTQLDSMTTFHNSADVILMATLMNIPDEMATALTKKVQATILKERKKQTEL